MTKDHLNNEIRDEVIFLKLLPRTNNDELRKIKTLTSQNAVGNRLKILTATNATKRTKQANEDTTRPVLRNIRPARNMEPTCRNKEHSCVRKSQAIATKLGMEAQNLKGKIEFVCGTNRILTSCFMPPSWILAYYSIDSLTFFKSL
jgi:hypothetical protein